MVYSSNCGIDFVYKDIIKIAVLRESSLKWICSAWEDLRDNPTLVQAGWRRTGISQAMLTTYHANKYRQRALQRGIRLDLAPEQDEQQEDNFNDDELMDVRYDDLVETLGDGGTLEDAAVLAQDEDDEFYEYQLTRSEIDTVDPSNEGETTDNNYICTH